MEELSDRDLFRVRLRFLDLVKSFFTGRPEAETLARWRGTFQSLAREQISPDFDAAVVRLSKALSSAKLQQVQEDYSELFENPFAIQPVELTASYHLDGRSYSQSLVDIRGIMGKARIIKEQEVREPEDSLVVILDTMGTLVELERQEGGEEVVELQRQLLARFLLPFARSLVRALKGHDSGAFYLLCAELLASYLELEGDLVGIQA